MSVISSPRSTRDDHRSQSATEVAVVHTEVSPAVLVLHGDVGVSSTLLLADAMATLLSLPDGDVVVDLADVEFIDIAAIRVLDLGRQRLLRQGRELTFRSPSRLCIVLLDLFGLASRVESSEQVQQ